MNTEPHRDRADPESPEHEAMPLGTVDQDTGVADEPTPETGAVTEVSTEPSDLSQETSTENEAADSRVFRETEEERTGSPPAPKRSPAEAFTELAETVHLLRCEVEGIGSFVQVCKDKLIRQADEYRTEGMDAALDSLMRLHDLVFHQVTAIEAGNASPDTFIVNLLETVEAELQMHSIEVIRPQPGEELNLEVMTTIGTVGCRFWRKPGSVAQVACCGFVRSKDSERRILQKAKVTVYRRKQREE